MFKNILACIGGAYVLVTVYRIGKRTSMAFATKEELEAQLRYRQ